MGARTIVKVIASGLVWRDGALLLLRRARHFEELAAGCGLWEPPGGRVEAGERIDEALVREVREEAGIAVVAPALVDVCSYVLRAGDVVAHRVHIFYAVHTDAAPRLADSDEHAAHRWVRRAGELDCLEMLPEIRAVVASRLEDGAPRSA